MTAPPLLGFFSTPIYGSLDPTPLMALVFPLFFGVILEDMADGLVLLVCVLWARQRWKHGAGLTQTSCSAMLPP